MTQPATPKPTRLLYTALLTALTGGAASFLGDVSAPSREAKFLEGVKRTVNRRVTKVGKALPGLRIPADPWSDQFNAVIKVVSDLDLHKDPVDGVVTLQPYHTDKLEQDLTRALIQGYFADETREAK